MGDEEKEEIVAVKMKEEEVVECWVKRPWLEGGEDIFLASYSTTARYFVLFLLQ